MNRSGFTLIELMIVVAIVSILSSLGLASFTRMQVRAKRAELRSNVEAIRVAEGAYYAAFDTYLSETTYRPDDSPGKAARAWVSGTAFDDLGWRPDSHVRGSYKVVANGSVNFDVTGISEVNGDGHQAVYTATKSHSALLEDEF